MSDFDTDDDFDLDGFDDDFGDLENKGTLGDLWRNNPFIKIAAIVLGLVLLIGIVMLFTGKKEEQDASRMREGSDVTEVPGTEAVTENYRQAIEESNTVRLEEALRKNESAVPMPVEAPKGVIPLEVEKPNEVDPLDRWRKLQEDKVKRAAKKAVIEESDEPEVDTKTPAIQALSGAMVAQMESILKNQKIEGAQTASITDFEYLEDLQDSHDELQEDRRQELEERRGNSNGFGGTTDENSGAEIILPAGTIEYAQLITEANTDVPGPILAEVMTGPFKGGRLIGTFEETYNYLTLNFNTIVLDGIDYTADAVAIDPETTLPGMVTDINRRYFSRVVLPVAADFITGFASAISSSGNTSITISGDSVTETTSNNRSNDQEVALGIAQAGEGLAEVLNEVRENTPQLLRVRAGTPMGIFFVSSVTNRSSQQRRSVGSFREINDDGSVAENPPPVSEN